MNPVPDRRSLSTAAGEAGDTAAQEAIRFGQLMRGSWTRNATLVRDAAGNMRAEAAAVGSRTRLYVKDEPVKSVGVAGAYGAVVTGVLIWWFRGDR